MIKLQIIGSLGKDCVTKEVNGKNVINFSVAHSEKWKDAQGELKEKTTWVEAAYWTDKTGLVPYLTKGKLVYIEGTPEADAYLDKEGKAKGTLRLRVATVQLLSGGEKAALGPTTSQPVANNAMSAPVADPPPIDDLPF